MAENPYQNDLANGIYPSFTATKKTHSNPINRYKIYTFNLHPDSKPETGFYYCRKDKETNEDCYNFQLSSLFYNKYWTFSNLE
jgi:hypothetical protein